MTDVSTDVFTDIFTGAFADIYVVIFPDAFFDVCFRLQLALWGQEYMKTPLANPRRSFFEDCLESGFYTGIKAYEK